MAKGKRIEDMTALEGKLIDAGIKEYDSHLAKKMLHEQTGKYEKIAEWDIGKSANNAKISYYNRTWETFEFQSCMLEALRNYMAIIANNIYSTYKDTNNTNRI